MHAFRRFLLCISLAVLSSAGVPANAQAQTLEWRYGHMNPPSSAAGFQAAWFAEAVEKNTGGRIKIKVYPNSSLGKTQELAKLVASGGIALSHNTAAGIGSLYEPFAALDTPYLYRDVDHLMKTVDIDSPVMKKLNEGLVKSAGVRVLYAYYFGTRELTANRAITQPSELSGLKIRAIPFPVYMAAVQGLGAEPVAVDWSEVPKALAAGTVVGQENPANVVLSSKLYETQTHMMLTEHILNAQVVVINEKIWQDLKPELRDAVTKAAQDVRKRATEAVRSMEAWEIAKLKNLNMKVIGPENGLKLDAFKAAVGQLVSDRLAPKFGDLYKEIAAIR
jgi:tripartite ATP-independent transporter DctP family solute receptor